MDIEKRRSFDVLLNSLCAVAWTNYIVDGIVALFALISVIVCAKKGFIDCFFGTISTIVALVVAIAFAKTVVSATDGLFGLQGFLQGKLEGVFAKLNGFTADISQSGVEAALEEQNVSAILAGLVMKLVGKQESIPEGTTLAMLCGEGAGSLATTLIAGLALFIVAKLIIRLLRGVLNAVAENIGLVRGVNVLLGAAVGFLQALLIVCVILAVLAIFPNEAIAAYLSKTYFIGKLYLHNPLVSILGAMI